MMRGKKKYWLFAAGTLVAAALVFFFFPLPQPNPIVDECKYVLARVIGKIGDTEIQLNRVSCGLEMPYFEVLAHSPKITEAAARENSLEISVDDTCETFADSLYNQADVLIGCCPLPGQTAGEQRETVFVTRVDPATGKFDPVDHASSVNTVVSLNKKTGKRIISPSCSAKTLKVDYSKLEKE